MELVCPGRHDLAGQPQGDLTIPGDSRDLPDELRLLDGLNLILLGVWRGNGGRGWRYQLHPRDAAASDVAMSSKLNGGRSRSRKNRLRNGAANAARLDLRMMGGREYGGYSRRGATRAIQTPNRGCYFCSLLNGYFRWFYDFRLLRQFALCAGARNHQ